jgi:hypothetical protein
MGIKKAHVILAAEPVGNILVVAFGDGTEVIFAAELLYKLGKGLSTTRQP